ncbi:MAG TPA: hypothetical protein VLL73_04790 [Desulfurivibrionaceae bacterium]|nr:hypothetical protein [Desulfurivibrionaceae bacterium]
MVWLFGEEEIEVCQCFMMPAQGQERDSEIMPGIGSIGMADYNLLQCVDCLGMVLLMVENDAQHEKELRRIDAALAQFLEAGERLVPALSLEETFGFLSHFLDG